VEQRILRHRGESPYQLPSNKSNWYILHRVKALSPLDFCPCKEFGEWFFWQSGEDPFFSSCVHFTDKEDFTRNSILIFATNTFRVTLTHVVKFIPDINSSSHLTFSWYCLWVFCAVYRCGSLPQHKYQTVATKLTHVPTAMNIHKIT
jgi:hypothetical protein